MEGFEDVASDREAWLSEAGYENGFLFEVFYCADLSVLSSSLGACAELLLSEEESGRLIANWTELNGIEAKLDSIPAGGSQVSGVEGY